MAREELVHGRLGHESAVVEDRDPVADPLDVREDVRAHEDGRDAPQLPDQLQHVAPALRVESAHGLVEEEDVGARQHRLAHAQALSHAAGVAADAAARGLDKAHRLQDLVDPRAERLPGEPVGAAHERQQLAPGHPAVEPRILVEVADPSGQVDAATTDRNARDGR